MKEMKTTEAAGQVLCHDVTWIIRDVTKDEGMLHVRSR